MGILIENPVFLDSYTGFDNLKMLAELKGKADTEDITNSLKRVGLDPTDKRKYRKYSLGMKQRLGIAATLIDYPKMLILDEPLNALDKAGISLFSEIIEEEKNKGTLIIISCHDEQMLNKYADEIVIIEEGRIIKSEGVDSEKY